MGRLCGGNAICSQHGRLFVSQDREQFLLLFGTDSSALGGLLEEFDAAGKLLGVDVEMLMHGGDGWAPVVGGAAGGGGEVVEVLLLERGDIAGVGLPCVGSVGAGQVESRV